MKKLVLAATAAAFISTPAMAAPTDSESFRIGANVQPECSVEDPENVRFGRLEITEEAGEGALLLTEGRYDSGQTVWTSCNYAASITISGEPMQNIDATNDGPDAGDFQDFLHYRITWRSDNGNDFLQANLRTINDSSVTREQTAAFHNEAILNTAIDAADNRLRPLAGRYRGVATISLGAI